MNTRNRLVIDGILLLVLTIVILWNLSGYLVEQVQQMEERESYMEDKQFFIRSSFLGVVQSKEENLFRSEIRIKLFRFEKLRYNYSYYKFDFTRIKDSVAILYFNKDTYNRIQVGDTIKKERNSFSIKINTNFYDFY
ncbi:hypothetical protein [Butyricimonas sp.]|uniref:hypothetical protein n=1 Tax=Butyricimonas sp. TaxID=1969738 RepID=UPI0025C46C83|nr:hypothetical protein [Butyricimonas sp.]